MDKIFSFVIVYIVVYLFYLFFVILRKNKLIKIKNGSEALLLKRKFKLKLDRISDKHFANIIALINGFIIATTFVVIEFFNNYIIKIMVAFVVLTILILIIYLGFGKYLKKKEGK